MGSFRGADIGGFHGSGLGLCVDDARLFCTGAECFFNFFFPGFFQKGFIGFSFPNKEMGTPVTSITSAPKSFLLFRIFHRGIFLRKFIFLDNDIHRFAVGFDAALLIRCPLLRDPGVRPDDHISITNVREIQCIH